MTRLAQTKKRARKKREASPKTKTTLVIRIVEEIVRIDNPNNPVSEPSLLWAQQPRVIDAEASDSKARS